jgi:hypothetical protein
MFLQIAQPGKNLNAECMVWTSVWHFFLAKYECYHYESLFLSTDISTKSQIAGFLDSPCYIW